MFGILKAQFRCTNYMRIAIALSIISHNEKLTWQIAAGGAVMIAGSVLIALSDTKYWKRMQKHKSDKHN